MECELCDAFAEPPYETDNGLIVCEGCFWDFHYFSQHPDIPRSEDFTPDEDQQ